MTELAGARDIAEAGRQDALAALARLNTASGKLQKAAEPSLLEHLTPKIGIGGAVGLDWLANATYLEADLRVRASDGLPASMVWEWDSLDGGSLRQAIDEDMARMPA